MAPTKKTPELTDSELIADFVQRQNTHSFSLLYRRYSGRVFAKCISMLRDEGLARDAVQEIFIKILLNLSKFNEQSTFSTWVYSITYNFCIDIIRKKKKVQVIYSDDIGDWNKQPEIEIPDSVLLEMKHERLMVILEKIPPGDKAILLMKYQDDMSIKDISEGIGKTESAVKMQIMRAKMKAVSVHEEIYGREFITA